MKYPKYLKKGDTIGLFAPSFGANIEPYNSRLKKAIETFQNMGFKLVMEGNLFGYYNGASDTKEARAKAFINLYTNPKVDFLWSIGGGEWMMDILPLIDFEALKNYPAKYVMGYSDNTNLTFLMNTLLDTASIVGQNITEFGMFNWDTSLNQALGIITGSTHTQQSFMFHDDPTYKTDDPFASYALVIPSKWDLVSGNQVTFSGRFIGGTLDILLLYPGTKYDHVQAFNESYKKDGIVWFLEACDLNLFAIKRALWQLKEAGWFQYLKGFIFGRPLNGSDIIGITQKQILEEMLSEYNVPIIYNADIGHIAPTFTLISGAYVTVHYENGKGSITHVLK